MSDAGIAYLDAHANRRADQHAAHDPDLGDLDPPRAPSTEERVRLRPMTVPELRSAQAPRWLVRLVIQHRALVLVWGAPGSGKTFLVLDLACSIARETMWFGRRISAQHRGVVYVCGEGHLRHRLEAYMRAHDLDDEDLVGLRVVACTMDLLSSGADLMPLIVQMKRAGEEMGGIALVVLDTLNSMMPGGDENSSEDMGAMIAAAKTIGEQMGCAVVFVHHAGKTEGSGARGHSSLRAAVDTELVVRDTGSHRTCTVEKQRDGETGAEFAFKLRSVDLGVSEDPDAEPDERESSCVVEPLIDVPEAPRKAAKRDIALDALREALEAHGRPLPGSSTIPPGIRGVELSAWQARFRLLSGDDYKTDEIAGAAFRRERKKLLEARKVGCSGTLAWLTE